MRIDLPAAPERVLIIKPSALGDIVHTLPVLLLLRRKFPAARIDWLVNPAFASLLRGHRLLNDVVPFDRRRFGRAWREWSAARELVDFAVGLRRRRYDLVIDLQGLLRSGLLTWQTGAATRVGFAAAREGAALAYTHVVPSRGDERHAVERYLDVAEALGCGRGPVAFDFDIHADVRQSVHDLVGDGKYAVLLPGTNWPTKRWPAERFAELVGPIRRHFGFRVFLAGANDVAHLAFPDAVSLAGKTDQKQLVVLLEKASLVVANDSGPMHIAAALGRPLVTLFGPTNPVRTGPYGRPDTVLQLDLVCRPCYARQCLHQSCLRWVGADDVMRVAHAQVTGTPLPV